MFSKTTVCFSCIRVSIDIFPPIKKLSDYPTMDLVPCKETWWAKQAKNWIMVWFVSRYKLSFQQSKSQDFFRKSVNQQFCFCPRSVKIHMFLSFFLRNFDWPNLPRNYVNVRCAFVSEITFFGDTGSLFSVIRQPTNFKFWNRWHKVLLLSAETRWGDFSKTCKCMWFFLRFQLICLQYYRLNFSNKDSVDNFNCV